MARGGEAQQALLPPVAGRRRGAGAPGRGVAEPQRLGRRHSGRGRVMNLVERYLAAIERGQAQAADIKAELRDVLLSRIEEQEEKLGHPLTRAELEALLVDFGHPLVVAGRYRRIQHLIGPEVFPFWWAALKTTLAVLAGVYL